MKVLFIGGTGTISSAVSRLAVARGIDLYHLNRGKRGSIEGVKTIHGDIKDVAGVARAIEGHSWDAVVDWIGFVPADVERDTKLFRDKTKQYIFISSASAYQKPPTHPIITESTPLANPYWEYSRNKIACEELLNRSYRETGFPITIVRPSLTYDSNVIPLAVGGWSGYTLIDRLKRGFPLVVHGDGSSLWTITHSEDFAKGFVGLLGHQQAIGHAFHITSDEVLTWNQAYEALAWAVGTQAKLVHLPSDYISDVCDSIGQPGMRGSLLGDKSWSTIFDNSKLKTFVPDYCATISFAEGMRRTVRWFEADASRQRVDAETNRLLEKLMEGWPGAKR